MFHEYKIQIETKDVGPPINIYLYRTGESNELATYEGKSLTRGLKQVTDAIKAEEASER